jgi:hypothetical protein
MSTPDEIMKSVERQFNMIRDALLHGEYNLAINAADILHTSLKVKVNELNEGRKSE